MAIRKRATKTEGFWELRATNERGQKSNENIAGNISQDQSQKRRTVDEMSSIGLKPTTYRVKFCCNFLLLCTIQPFSGCLTLILPRVESAIYSTEL